MIAQRKKWHGTFWQNLAMWNNRTASSTRWTELILCCEVLRSPERRCNEHLQTDSHPRTCPESQRLRRKSSATACVVRTLPAGTPGSQACAGKSGAGFREEAAWMIHRAVLWASTLSSRTRDDVLFLDSWFVLHAFAAFPMGVACWHSSGDRQRQMSEELLEDRLEEQ